MDKNFVNVDDLVRQRLSGGEEKERAGAWMRMSELLEQEEKSRPVGLYWRRMFGALGVLFLITSVTVAGYKMSSLHNGNSSSYMPLIAANNVAKSNGSDAVNENSPASKTENIANNDSKVSLTTTPESAVASNTTSTNHTSHNTNSTNSTSNNISSTNTSSNKTTSAKSISTESKTASIAHSTANNTIHQLTTNTNTTEVKTASTNNHTSTKPALNNDGNTTSSEAKTASTNNHKTTKPSLNNDGNATSSEVKTASTNNHVATKPALNNDGKATSSDVKTGVGSSHNNKSENLIATNQTSKNKSDKGTKSIAAKSGTTSSIGALNSSVNNNTVNTSLPSTNQVNNTIDATKPVNSNVGISKTTDNNEVKTTTGTSDNSQVASANNKETQPSTDNKTNNNKTGNEPIAANNNAEKGHGHRSNHSSNTHHTTSVTTGTNQNTDNKVAKANQPSGNESSIASTNGDNKTAIAKNNSEPVKKSNRHHTNAINNNKQTIANKNTSQPKAEKSTTASKNGDKVAKTNNKATQNQVANNDTKTSANNDGSVATTNKATNTAHHTSKHIASTASNTSVNNNEQITADTKNSVAKTTADAQNNIAKNTPSHQRTNRRNTADIKKMNQLALAANNGGPNGNSAKVATIANNGLPTGGGNQKNNTSIAKTNNTADNGTIAKNDPKTTTANKQGAKGGSATGTTNTDVANNSTQKHITREMQVIVLKQSKFRSEPNQKDFKFDTISNEKIIEYANNEENSSTETSTAGKNSYAAKSGNKNAFGQTKNVLGAGSSAETKQSKDGSLKAGDNESALDAAKNISAAFNDIKYKVGNAIFAPGITAGINGTFFGPNSFKGFQFGITGKFIFGEDISIMGELKYFNRSNNDFSMTDNFYRYTQNQGSTTFSKEQVSNTYSFSTLHSFEVPISVRYMVGNFDFFGGFNIIYNLGINIDAAPPIVANPVPGIFSQIGNDSKPALAVSDFDSKFGLGYLFGFSYQLSPNLALDIRNVQTFWNSGGGSGAKYVSDQLYKSPSLQLSLSYRLGGRNIKD